MKPFFFRQCATFALLLVALRVESVYAQVEAPEIFTESSTEEKYERMTRVSAEESIAPLGDSLFGDSTSYYTGNTTFSVTDIDLPGNSALPVRLTRTHSATEVKGPLARGLLGEWELEVPHMHGTFSRINGWDVGGADPNQRCSTNPNNRNPRSALATVNGGPAGVSFGALDFWNGNFLSVPGAGDQLLLVRTPENTLIPTNGTVYPWATVNHWQLSCLQTLANGEAGEGFKALSPDGSKYTFNWMARRPVDLIQRRKLIPNGSAGFTVFYQLERDKVFIYATRVEDRFNNWVEYEYVGDKLQKIEANDGRKITFEYDQVTGKLRFARAHGRTWEYRYSQSKRLTEVVRPDGSKWTYDTTPFIYIYRQDSAAPICGLGRLDPVVTRKSYTFTHPSGAVGVFEFDPIRHARFGARPKCRLDEGQIEPGVSEEFDTYALANKTISGPGVPSQSWTLAYQPQALANTTKTAVLTMPNGQKTRLTFGTEFYKNEGKLVKEEVLDQFSNILKSSNFEYLLEPRADVLSEFAFMPGSGILGNASIINPDDFANTHITPLLKSTVTQQGETFTTRYDGFIVTGKPELEFRTSSISSGVPRYETRYQQNLNKWVLDLVESNIVMAVRDGYEVAKLDLIIARDPTTLLPTTRRVYGDVVRTYQYNTDGTLFKITDPGLKTITLSNWNRGVPQTLQYADQTTTTETIDDFGAVVSQTDELGNITSIARDSMGRIEQIAHPANDSVAWNNLNANFQQSSVGAYGLPAQHWQRTITLGNQTRRTYYDALWRPVLVEQWDTSNASATKTFVITKFDYANRPISQSYPVRSITSFSQDLPGISTTYDALGRVIGVLQHSEQGLLVTTNEYLAGFKKRVTNPRNKQTLYSFQAFGEPTEDYPVKIEMPEQVTVEIERDLIGRPLHTTRTGNGPNNSTVTLTRSHYYDVFDRLCSEYDPERGSSGRFYNADGTVGVAATVAGDVPVGCNGEAPDSIAATKRITYGYDPRKRLTSVTHGDGSAGSTFTYYDDGALSSASSDGNVWTYRYNKRRLLEGETLDVDGKTFDLSYGYDPNGAQSSLTYPDGYAIAYAPNALGQASQVGPFATNIQYYANGSIDRFDYGNALKHKMTQNARLMPARVQVGSAANASSVLDTTLGFDVNGNVMSLTDPLSTNHTRSMTYDDLDRLKTVASSSSMFGNAIYSYDGLDNVRTLVTAGPKARSYTYNYDAASQRLQSVTGTPGTISFAYGERGNVSTRSSVGSTQSFGFDLADRIRSFTSSDATKSENYSYDASGRRVKITRANDLSKTRYQVYSQNGQLLWELDSNNNPTRHVYLGETLLARDEALDTSTLAPPASLAIQAVGIPFSGGQNYPLAQTFRLSWPATSPAIAGATYKVQACQFVESATCDWNNNTLQNTSALIWVSPVTAGLPFAGNMIFRVATCVGLECGAWRYSSYQGVMPAPASAPTVPATANGAYVVSWPAVIGDARYDIQRATSTSGPWTLVASNISSVETTELPGTAGTYYYRVQAKNAYGTRGFSGASSGVLYTPPATCNPNVPQGFVATGSNLNNGVSTTGNYNLGWQASCNTQYYIIERQINGLINGVYNVNTTSFSESNLANANYTYRIQACGVVKGSSVCSGFTSPLVIQVQVPSGLAAPANLSTSSTQINSGATATINWDPVAGAHHYKLHVESDRLSTLQVIDPVVAPYSFSRGVMESTNFTINAYACSATNICSAPSNPITIFVRCTSQQCSARTSKSTVVTYIHTDQLGSPVAETDSSGVLKARFRYEPYGLSLESTINQGPSYTGHVADANSGLIYMQQRYYDPVIGRFLSPDPAKSEFNRYNYAANNPYKYVDPDGRFPVLIPIVEGCAVNPVCANGARMAGRAIAKEVAGRVIAPIAEKIDSSIQNAVGEYANAQRIEEDTAGQDTAGDEETAGDTKARPQTSEERALSDMIEEDTLGNRKPLSAEDADAAMELGEELGLKVRDDRGGKPHWKGPHIHIEKIDPRHIRAAPKK